MSQPVRILYCHCTYAQVVPRAVKEAVLKQLCDAGVAFEAVADLCEMSARKDAALQRLASAGAIKIAACHARAVKGLFRAAGAPLPAEGAEILDMRAQPAEKLLQSLQADATAPALQPSRSDVCPAPEAQNPKASGEGSL
jgi:hypothetical protein